MCAYALLVTGIMSGWFVQQKAGQSSRSPAPGRPPPLTPHPIEFFKIDFIGAWPRGLEGGKRNRLDRFVDPRLEPKWFGPLGERCKDESESPRLFIPTLRGPKGHPHPRVSAGRRKLLNPQPASLLFLPKTKANFDTLASNVATRETAMSKNKVSGHGGVRGAI